MCGHTRDPIIYSNFHRNPFKGFGTPGGQNLALLLLWLVAFTTACTTVQAVMEQVWRHPRVCRLESSWLGLAQPSEHQAAIGWPQKGPNTNDLICRINGVGTGGAGLATAFQLSGCLSSAPHILSVWRQGLSSRAEIFSSARNLQITHGPCGFHQTYPSVTTLHTGILQPHEGHFLSPECRSSHLKFRKMFPGL